MRFRVKDVALVCSEISAEMDVIRVGAEVLPVEGLDDNRPLLHFFKDLDVGEDHLESGLSKTPTGRRRLVEWSG